MKCVIAILFLLFVSASAAGAQNLDKGREAFEKEDYKVALEQFLPLAEQGNAEAQYFVGVIYFENLGKVVPQDDITAVKWLRAAAERGFGSAQLHMGTAYYLGAGVIQDNVLAYMWFNLATGAQKWPVSETKNYKAIHVKRASVVRDRTLTRKMTRTEIKEAQRRSREWLDAHPR